MPRYWARWYEPKTDPWLKVEAVVCEALLDSVAAAKVIAALHEHEFDIEWPFWELPSPPSAPHLWKSGESANGDYAVICAVFDAPDEATVRREIGDRQAVTVDLKADDWMPGDRFPVAAAAGGAP
jgi:hypothetical protein